MEIINIIVSDNETPILSIKTFGVIDTNDSASIDAAEKFYADMCKTIKFGDNIETEDADDFDNEINDSLDDGYIEIRDNTVSFLWSSIDNIQF